MAAPRSVLIYARICLRLALQRDKPPLEALGLAGVQSRERMQGLAQSRSGRFDAPGFPVLYAAEALRTCQLEVAHHLKVQYLDRLPRLPPQTFRYQILEVPLAGRFEDLRSRADLKGLQSPSRIAYPACRQYAVGAHQAGLDGLLYRSSRHPGGTCLARFVPPGQRIPTEPAGTWLLPWTGKRLLLGN
jgi:hypothetical protein